MVMGGYSLEVRTGIYTDWLRISVLTFNPVADYEPYINVTMPVVGDGHTYM